MTGPDWNKIDTDPAEEVESRTLAWWFIWTGAVCAIAAVFGLPTYGGWAGLAAGVLLLISGLFQLIDTEPVGPASDDDPEIPSW